MICKAKVRCISCGFCIDCSDGLACPITGEIHLKQPRSKRGRRKKVTAPRLAARKPTIRYQQEPVREKRTTAEIDANQLLFKLPVGINKIQEAK